MISSSNLYDYLLDDSDNEMNLLTTTSSISNDSAIVIDENDQRQINYRNSWPIDITRKYQRPLPWTSSSTEVSINDHHCSHCSSFSGLCYIGS